MEYSIKITFVEEEKSFEVSYEKLNFEEIIKAIIKDDYLVTSENISVEKIDENSTIDVDALKEILIEVHGNYQQEIKDFHENILSEISTLSLDEELEEEILNHLQDNYNINISEKDSSDS